MTVEGLLRLETLPFRLSDPARSVEDAADEALRLGLFGSHKAARRTVGLARGLLVPDQVMETGHGPVIRTI